ncbi:MAG: hypothetical protein HY881_17735 [Deltaproteobacteria bacterium]|nr:hypothetical protein [Deltaproteobacteria bacterium]
MGIRIKQQKAKGFAGQPSLMGLGPEHFPNQQKQAIVIGYIFPDGSGSSTKQKILKGYIRRSGEKHPEIKNA